MTISLFQVNIHNFIKNNCIFQNKNIMREKVSVLHFANIFNVWLNKRQLDSPICLCMPSLLYTILVEIYTKNLASHKYVFGKRRVF